MAWLLYAVALPLVLLFLAFAGCAVHWAAKHGQLGALWSLVRSWLSRAEPAPTRSLDRESVRAQSWPSQS